MDIFTPASHHDLLILLVQVAVLLASSRIFGEIAQRLGQPSVVGELLAGIILGPSLLSGFFPFINEWLVPQNEVQGYLIELVGMVGAMFLLIITGLETDIPLIKRKGKIALSIAAGGLILPFVSGFAMAVYLPDFLVQNEHQRIVFDLFVATAMAISSIPVVAKVLMDLNLMRRDLGQTILAAGMIDDTTAWVLLSITLGLASGDAVTVGTVFYAIAKIAAFMTLSFTIGKWLIKKGLYFIQDRSKSEYRILTFVVVIAFIFGAFAQALEVEAVLGAFVAGIIFGMLPRLPQNVIHKLEAITIGIFAPIFFAVSGLKVDITSLMQPNLLLVTGIVLAVAIFGKLVGAYTGARIVGLDHWNSLAFGSALNARGAVEIIIASIGLSMGILSQDMYSIIVVMAMVTSLIAPSLLKWTVGKIKIGNEEKERLKKEEFQARSMVANIHRVLVPIRPRLDKYGDGPSAIRHELAAKILSSVADHNKISVTLLMVTTEDNTDQYKPLLMKIGKAFKNIEVEIKIIKNNQTTSAILEEAQKGYNLILLGATERDLNKSQLFNPIIDEVVRHSSCPTAVLQVKKPLKNWQPRQILVPSNGSLAAKNATELAFYITNTDEEHQVTVLNVIEKNKNRLNREETSLTEINHRKDLKKTITEENKIIGDSLKINTATIMTQNDNVENGILEAAIANNSDLIILGTNIYPGTNRLYLGRRVEKILEESECPVLIFNT